MKRAMLAAVLAVACENGRLDLERMLDQAKLEPYEESPFFGDGRGMRAPPEGAVARGAVLGPEALVFGTSGGADVSILPLPVTVELVTRGQNRFRVFCATCHGLLGDGRSQVAENMARRPPPSLHEPRLRELPAGALFRVISDGYGLMPSYAPQLSVEDRWAVVAYVQALELSQRVELDRLSPELAGKVGQWLK